MADPLEKIIRELRSRTCPPAVIMKRVGSRIDRWPAPGHRGRRLRGLA